jgi:hypothetical protein
MPVISNGFITTGLAGSLLSIGGSWPFFTAWESIGDSWNADARLEIPKVPEKNIIEIEKARLCLNNLVMTLPLRSQYIFRTIYNR